MLKSLMVILYILIAKNSETYDSLNKLCVVMCNCCDIELCVHIKVVLSLRETI